MFQKRTEFSYIVKASQYSEAFDKGKTFFSPSFTYKITPSEENKISFGIIVSKKVGNSVIRHSVKRKVRAVFLDNPQIWNNSQKVVLIAKPGAKTKSFGELQIEILRALYNAQKRTAK